MVAFSNLVLVLMLCNVSFGHGFTVPLLWNSFDGNQLHQPALASNVVRNDTISSTSSTTLKPPGHDNTEPVIFIPVAEVVPDLYANGAESPALPVYYSANDVNVAQPFPLQVDSQQQQHVFYGAYPYAHYYQSGQPYSQMEAANIRYPFQAPIPYYQQQFVPATNSVTDVSQHTDAANIRYPFQLPIPYYQQFVAATNSIPDVSQHTSIESALNKNKDLILGRILKIVKDFANSNKTNLDDMRWDLLSEEMPTTENVQTKIINQELISNRTTTSHPNADNIHDFRGLQSSPNTTDNETAEINSTVEPTHSTPNLTEKPKLSTAEAGKRYFMGQFEDQDGNPCVKEEIVVPGGDQKKVYVYTCEQKIVKKTTPRRSDVTRYTEEFTTPSMNVDRVENAGAVQRFNTTVDNPELLQELNDGFVLINDFNSA